MPLSNEESTADLETLFRPKSIAVIGASSNVDRIGGRPFKHLLAAGYQGELYAVNPSHKLIQGVRSYPAITAIEAQIDAAIIAIPAGGVLDAVRECAQKGVRSVVVFTAGFAEMGPQGKQLQTEIADVARRSGMRLLGPNTIGAFNATDKVYLTFTGNFQADAQKRRSVGIASQSGGYATNVLKLAQLRGLSVTHLVATGNEADVEVGEVIKWMAESSSIDVIVGYIEGLRLSENFMEGLRIARAKRKPVVILKVGTTDQGAAAVASHTSALAGADAIYDGIFREFGVHRAQTTEELLDVAYAATFGTLPKDERTCLITSSGGIGAHMADRSHRAGLRLPVLAETAQQEIKLIAPNGSMANPIDLTAQTNSGVESIVKAAEIALSTGDFGSVILYIGVIASAPHLAEPLLAALKNSMRRYPEACFCISMVCEPGIAKAFAEAGCLVFEDAARAVAAVGALAGFSRSFSHEEASVPTVRNMPAIERRRYSEVDAKAIIAKCGIRIPKERLLSEDEDLQAIADAIGYPLALKVVSADLPHKTEVGGVALDLRDAAEVVAALAAMKSSIVRLAPTARIDGYLLSEMIGGGVECIVGASEDPVFGPIIMFGVGGVMVEILSDVVFRRAPLDAAGAREMIHSVRSFPLLSGFRGKPKADVAALARAIADFSQLVAHNSRAFNCIEINPLLVLPDGQGVVALDANIDVSDLNLDAHHGS